jgi:hypothetical protein
MDAPAAIGTYLAEFRRRRYLRKEGAARTKEYQLRELESA